MSSPLHDAPMAYSQTRRGWGRPHLSAIVAGLCIALFLSLWNMAGRQSIASNWHFGWPWEFATCEPIIDEQLEFVLNSQDTMPFGWQRSFVWNKWERLEIAAFRVCQNVAICGALAAVVGVVVEIWRRQRRRVWQIYLREFLGASVLLSAAIGLGTQFSRQAGQTEKSVARLKSHIGKGGGLGVDYGLPAVIRENLPEAQLKPFDRVVFADAGVHLGFDDEDLRFLATQPHLRSLSLQPAPGCGPRIAACSQLTSLTLWNGRLCNEDLRAIAAVDKLRRLRVSCPILPPRTLAVCGAMRSLKELTLRGRLLGFRTKSGELLDYVGAESREDIADAEDLKADLRELAGLESLETLELNKLMVAEDCLVTLAQLRNLKLLDLGECQYNSADLGGLKRLRPEIEIQINDR